MIGGNRTEMMVLMADRHPPFKRVLVANRGEIALRIIRGIQDAGAESVAVYSNVDAALPHVRAADLAYEIGPAAAAESYLNAERILDVARRAGADALHPGYGFLAENADFARACRDAGIAFVGPSPESMESMGDKIASRRTMSQAGVPVIPGTIDPITDPAEVARIAAEVGYPVMIKASAGGGGRGIRVVHSEPELVRAMRNAQQEAQAAFGNGAIFVEKMISPARHIEVQLIADQHGNVVTLGERECSLQRRRQKLIEEAPSPVMRPKLRARMEDAAKTVARACDYVNVATVEFLVYDKDQFAFLEMNTRLQVEHPVTELVRGVDLVRDQLRVAAGQPLGYTGNDHPIRGWAMECRITAEDPFNDFLPSLGPIPYYLEPSGPGIRVDGMLHAGMEVSMHYDSLLAKLIVWGEDREQCLQRMRRALDEFVVLGVATSIPFHRALLDDPRFIAGDFNTEYIEDIFLDRLPARPDTTAAAAVAAAVFLQERGETAGPDTTASRRTGSTGRAWGMYARGRRSTLEMGWRRNYL